MLKDARVKIVDTEHGRLIFSDCSKPVASTITAADDMNNTDDADLEEMFELIRKRLEFYKRHKFPLVEIHLVSKLSFNGLPVPALPHYQYNSEMNIVADLYIDKQLIVERLSAQSQRLEYLRHLVDHEAYHVVEALMMSDQSRQQLCIDWHEIRCHSGEFPSEYAKTCSAEDRAETFALLWRQYPIDQQRVNILLSALGSSIDPRWADLNFYRHASS